METVRTDVVVVGGGAAGLLAAVAARRLGHEVLVVEATGQVGGSTAPGDGRLWLPANHLMEAGGTADSVAAAAEYLDAVLGAPTEASSAARRAAYLESAPKLARWLTQSRLPLLVDREASDYYPEAPGAKSSGRVLRNQAFDLRALGEWERTLNGPQPSAPTPLPRRVLGRFNPRHASHGSGEALTAELLHRAVGNGVELWLDSPVTAVIPEEDGVRGVIVQRLVHGTDSQAGVRVEAQVGVILTGGGFEANQELREEHLPLPTDASWSVAGAPNDGSVIELAVAAGAATTALGEAWWTPVMLAEGVAHPLGEARLQPHAIIVDQTGSRFLDETAPAAEVGRQLYDRSHGFRAIPSYLIVDNRSRREYQLGPWAAGNAPRAAVESGDLVRSGSLDDLAQTLGVDRAGLIGSTVRFNGFARKGHDLDFERGDGLAPSGKGKRRKNPSLGVIEKPPFWAVRVYPGDHGTKGGLLVDADSRVLRADGSPIRGLFAGAGTAASIMGRTSPAPGVALGEALVGVFRGVLRMSQDHSAR